MLNEPDESFADNAGGSGYSGGYMSTPDGGTTWYVSTVTIDEYDFS